jgi:hypothetical protein
MWSNKTSRTKGLPDWCREGDKNAPNWGNHRVVREDEENEEEDENEDEKSSFCSEQQARDGRIEQRGDEADE